MAAKDVQIKARVTQTTRAELEAIAAEKGESLSLVVREAVNEYLMMKREGESPPTAKRKIVNYTDHHGGPPKKRVRK